MKKILNIIVVLLLFIGTFLGCATMYVAFQHNSQGEIFVDGIIDWKYLFMIGFAWAVIPYTVAIILLFVKKIYIKR